MLQPGAVRAHIKKGSSQAHKGVAALNPITHRNTGYQPLPAPLGLPPYHYDLATNFPDIAKNAEKAGKLVVDILGDSGGVQDGEFQGHVAEQMVKALDTNKPHFCYHVGDVVLFLPGAPS